MERHSEVAKSNSRSTRKMNLRSSPSPKCSVFSCKNTLIDMENKRPTLECFPFPKDEDVLEAWKKFCNKVDDICDDCFVCGDHFVPSDFVEPFDKLLVKNGNRTLKSDAVPSIYKPEVISGHPSAEATNVPIEDEKDFDKNATASSSSQRNKVLNTTSRTQMEANVPHHSKNKIPKKTPIRDCDSNDKEKFFNLLKEHAIILDTTIGANTRFRKTRALKKLATAYKKRFGKKITSLKLRKKIEGMLAYIRGRLSTPNTEKHLKKWEDDFVQLLQEKRLPLRALDHASCEDTSRAILSYNPNQHMTRSLMKSLMECSNRNAMLAAETEETARLSNNQLHRLLTLEQLKLIRLHQIQSQQEINRSKINYRLT